MKTTSMLRSSSSLWVMLLGACLLASGCDRSEQPVGPDPSLASPEAQLTTGDNAGMGVGIGEVGQSSIAGFAGAGVSDRVFFGTDRYDLDDSAQSTLRQQAAWMNQHPEVTFTIEGHADERGTRDYNLALAERRGDTIRNYLIALGVAGSRLEVISFGKERPECPEATEECWAYNRRGVTLAGN